MLLGPRRSAGSHRRQTPLSGRYRGSHTMATDYACLWALCFKCYNRPSINPAFESTLILSPSPKSGGIAALDTRSAIGATAGLGGAWHDGRLVLTENDGSPLDPDNVTEGLVKTAKEARCSGLRLRCIRHSPVSLMLKTGASPKAISKRFGHASISITMNVNAHLLPCIPALR